MNTPRTRTRQNTTTATTDVRPDFQQAPAPELVVEHRSIAGFLRVAPRRFHLDEMVRFGKKVGDVADCMQLSYLTTIDSSLGVVRIFPMPLMRRVYDVMAAQFGWQGFVEPEALEAETAEKREQVRSYERLSKMLAAFQEAANDPDIQRCTGVILERVEQDLSALRLELASDDEEEEEEEEPESPAR